MDTRADLIAGDSPKVDAGRRVGTRLRTIIVHRAIHSLLTKVRRRLRADQTCVANAISLRRAHYGAVDVNGNRSRMRQRLALCIEQLHPKLMGAALQIHHLPI